MSVSIVTHPATAGTDPHGQGTSNEAQTYARDCVEVPR